MSDMNMNYEQYEQDEEQDVVFNGLSEEEIVLLKQKYSGLKDEQYHFLTNEVTKEEGWKCYYDYWTQPQPTGGGLHCSAAWDTFICWPSTPANTTLYRPCPPNFGFNSSEPLAWRACNESGKWVKDDWTNYTVCLHYAIKHMGLDVEDTKITGVISPEEEYKLNLQRTIANTYFYMCIVSLIFLLITMFLFCYFKSLQCTRVTIHKNLVLSFILRFLVILIITGPLISGSTFKLGVYPWLCRTIISSEYYLLLANVFWMFVEGFFLHNRVAIAFFNSENSAVFYVIGWVIPAAFVIPWFVINVFKESSLCWTGATSKHWNLLLILPVGIALGINLLLLINIVRIIVTKLRASNTMETAQIRKAVRATVVLFPLLGITNMAFFFDPGEDPTLKKIYRITYAVMQPSQGILVSFVYCFLNGEVQTAIKRWWQRRRLRTVGGSRNRRRSSRTSSLFLSQTENQLVLPQITVTPL
ncbi:corticotropin-releasing factor receptor 2-like isoform X2 [Lineus longissimus]|uniref:corticotropin-releasing factor receptor 2-like isoform X2 n=1 Tax=Lineus longissimus TaxID=88925 RepID=UPI002B4CB7CB